MHLLICFHSSCSCGGWPDFLLFKRAHRLVSDFGGGDVNLGLHQVLRVLIPHSLVPLSLNGLFRLCQVLNSIVFHWPSAKFLIHLFEPCKNFLASFVAQSLILNIAVDVRAGHVRVEVSLNGDFEF